MTLNNKCIIIIWSIHENGPYIYIKWVLKNNQSINQSIIQSINQFDEQYLLTGTTFHYPKWIERWRPLLATWPEYMYRVLQTIYSHLQPGIARHCIWLSHYTKNNALHIHVLRCVSRVSNFPMFYCGIIYKLLITEKEIKKYIFVKDLKLYIISNRISRKYKIVDPPLLTDFSNTIKIDWFVCDTREGHRACTWYHFIVNCILLYFCTQGSVFFDNNFIKKCAFCLGA